MSIRILLCDDHGIFLTGLRSVLQGQSGMEIAGEAKSGDEALRLAREAKPDVIVMDITMAGVNGIDATRAIAAELPGVKVLCLSMHAEKRFVQAALQAGAAGYLIKDCALEELDRAIRTVAGGQVYLSPEIARTVVDAATRRRVEPESPSNAALTEREREILALIADGWLTKEIAERLHLSAKTVGTHRQHVMEKLGIRSVAGLTKYAIRQGLTTSAE